MIVCRKAALQLKVATITLTKGEDSILGENKLFIINFDVNEACVKFIFCRGTGLGFKSILLIYFYQPISGLNL
jgi:hypothetical protein